MNPIISPVWFYLIHVSNWDEEYTLNCEIYKVVDEKSFCNAVYDIIDLAVEVIRFTIRR